MDGCDSDSFDFCPAVKGTNATGTIEITTNSTISQMACSMSAFGLPVGIPCPVKDGCNSITNGAQCPIAPETKITYQIKIFIAAVYPEVREKFLKVFIPISYIKYIAGLRNTKISDIVWSSIFR